MPLNQAELPPYDSVAIRDARVTFSSLAGGKRIPSRLMVVGFPHDSALRNHMFGLIEMHSYSGSTQSSMRKAISSTFPFLGESKQGAMFKVEAAQVCPSNGFREYLLVDDSGNYAGGVAWCLERDLELVRGP